MPRSLLYYHCIICIFSTIIEMVISITFFPRTPRIEPSTLAAPVRRSTMPYKPSGMVPLATANVRKPIFQTLDQERAWSRIIGKVSVLLDFKSASTKSETRYKPKVYGSCMHSQHERNWKDQNIVRTDAERKLVTVATHAKREQDDSTVERAVALAQLSEILQ